MTETKFDEAAPSEPESAAPNTDELPRDEDRLERAKSSLVHAVEHAVGKVTDTLAGIGGRK